VDSKKKRKSQVPESKRLSKGVLGLDLANKGVRGKVVKTKRFQFSVVRKSSRVRLSKNDKVGGEALLTHSPPYISRIAN
jgi:hypothetical protein